MHILDFIIWIITCGILWKIMEVLSNGEFTEEIGGLIGLTVLIVYTLIYVILFVFIDFNWIDIFHSMKNFDITKYFQL